MNVLDSARQLDPPLWVTGIVVSLVILLVLYDAVLGRRSYQRFLAAMGSVSPEQAPQVRARFLLKWAWQPWVLTIVAVAFVAFAPGIALKNLGFAWPESAVFSDLIAEGGPLGGALVGAVIGLIAVAAIGLCLGLRKKTSDAGSSPQVNENLAPMLPTESVDRRAWLMLSITAGITEEIMYRGLTLVAFALLLPTAPNPIVYGLVIVWFGLAHLYQGWVGVATTGILGAVFLAIFVTTGSLLPGIVLHVLVDAKSALPTRR